MALPNRTEGLSNLTRVPRFGPKILLPDEISEPILPGSPLQID